MSRWSWRILIGGGVFLLARSAFAKGSSGAPVSSDAQLAFVGELWAAIGRAWSGSSIASRQLVLALAALESGYGRSTAYHLGKNPFNITKGSADVDSVSGSDQDCSSGVCKPITQKFRAYQSLEDAVTDLLSLLQAPRYLSAFHLLSAGDVGFAAALGNAGYYTLPISQYVSNFRGVLAGVQKRLATLHLTV